MTKEKIDKLDSLKLIIYAYHKIPLKRVKQATEWEKFLTRIIDKGLASRDIQSNIKVEKTFE